MNRIEYRAALESRLAAVPSAERAKQLDYYDEMICDRMEDGMTEEEAVAMLGDIDETAREIMSQYALPSPVSPAGADRPPAPDKDNRGGSHLWLWITLAILGSPIWISLLAALITVIAALVIVIWSLVISAFAIFVSAAAVGVVGIVFGIGSLFTASASYALFVIGAALAAAAIALFAVPLVKLIFKGAVYLTKSIGLLIAKPFRK